MCHFYNAAIWAPLSFYPLQHAGKVTSSEFNLVDFFGKSLSSSQINKNKLIGEFIILGIRVIFYFLLHYSLIYNNPSYILRLCNLGSLSEEIKSPLYYIFHTVCMVMNPCMSGYVDTSWTHRLARSSSVVAIVIKHLCWPNVGQFHMRAICSHHLVNISSLHYIFHPPWSL